MTANVNVAVNATRFSRKGTPAGDGFATAVKHAEVASMRVGSLKWIRVVWMMLLTVVCASAAFAQTLNTYGGEATAISGMVAGIPVNLAGTGTIDPSGGARHNSLVCYPGGLLCDVGVPDATSGLLSGQTLSATAVGRGGQTHAQSSVAKLALLVHGLLIKADYAHSEVKSICKDDGHGGHYSESTGRSDFSELTIGGTPITVSGLPNQLVNVPSPLGGIITVVINEQTVNNGYLTVRALHIKAPSILGLVSLTDLTVGHSRGKIDCGDVEQCFARKVTSGGFVEIPGGKLTFAASGQMASTWGHFVAVNHVTGDKLQATMQVTTFTPDGYAEITGTGFVNGVIPVEFTVRLKDNGEPGRNDRFSLTSTHPNFEVLDTTLDGGNIQFHKPKGDCEVPPPPEEIICTPPLILVGEVCVPPPPPPEE